MKKIIISHVLILTGFIFFCIYDSNAFTVKKAKNLDVKKIPLTITTIRKSKKNKNGFIYDAIKYAYGDPAKIKGVYLILDDTTFAFCVDAYSIGIYDIETGIFIRMLTGHVANITHLAMLSKNLIMSGAKNGEIKIWDWRSGNCKQTFEGHKKGISCLICLSPTGIASGSDDGLIKIWDLTTGKCRDIKAYTDSGIKRLLYIEEIGAIFSSSNKDEIKCFNVETGGMVTKKIKTTNDSILGQYLISGLQYFPCWRIFMYSNNGILYIRQREKGVQQRIEMHGENEDVVEDPIQKILLSQDLKKIIATTYFGSIIVMSISPSRDLHFFFKNLREIMPAKKKKPHFEDLEINFN